MKIYCNALNPEKHQDLLKKRLEFTNLDNLLTISDAITVNILLNEQNKIVTPHIAGVTKETIKRMDIELANNIIEL